MAKEKETITVCSDCKVPTIFTFAFDGTEYFCMNCLKATEFFGSVEAVEATPELKAQRDVLKALWTTIYKFYIPLGRFGKSNCKKCQTSNNHRDHLTKKEINGDIVATKILSALKNNLV